MKLWVLSYIIMEDLWKLNVFFKFFVLVFDEIFFYFGINIIFIIVFDN